MTLAISEAAFAAGEGTGLGYAPMRQKPFPTPHRPDISVWVRHCPKCDPLRVMNIKTIRPAMFGGYDLVIYECRQSEKRLSGQ